MQQVRVKSPEKMPVAMPGLSGQRRRAQVATCRPVLLSPPAPLLQQLASLHCSPLSRAKLFAQASAVARPTARTRGGLSQSGRGGVAAAALP